MTEQRFPNYVEIRDIEDRANAMRAEAIRNGTAAAFRAIANVPHLIADFLRRAAHS